MDKRSGVESSGVLSAHKDDMLDFVFTFANIGYKGGRVMLM